MIVLFGFEDTATGEKEGKCKEEKESTNFKKPQKLKSLTIPVTRRRGSPVPIPNTEVKLYCDENTWWETARENSLLPVL